MQPKAPGSRLKPVADTLESVGFVSKGDKKLLNHQAQNEYFNKITDRYMKFCFDNKSDLEAALISMPTSASGDATSNPPAALPSAKQSTVERTIPSPSSELSTLLLSLRKLREALLATAKETPVDFIQRVHAFSIQLAVRARHPPSYFPSLRYSLDKLHTRSHPLSESDLQDVVSYLILDYACRQDDMLSAFELRARARRDFAFSDQDIDQVLVALMHGNWVVFWRVRNSVDCFRQAIMDWAMAQMRRRALKAVGSAYLSVPVDWVLNECIGFDEGWTWEKLVEHENLGWEKDGEKIIIRRPKTRTRLNPEAAPANKAES
ncbi:Uncharacterized protein PECH_008325 [Penicillium ucsense]|uniref:Uncharacterized protein n=1 Tax=Penicillium ucsense TaxID=2839758 RepID=A0A8J8W2K5_9EURO|nr:Uncharacterized protein PECM_008166 [Penicillium ucsense]KAF7734224.1 Uncharacterized protein PECH_008325 [Penicillium ucsense]